MRREFRGKRELSSAELNISSFVTVNEGSDGGVSGVPVSVVEFIPEASLEAL
jgi:hypothetical protein